LFSLPPLRLLIMGFIASFLLYWFVGYIGLDPDLGWHIKVGELVRTQGIPSTDPFSYTMPSYPFVDHEWVSNILVERAYNAVGMVGVAFLFALMAASIPLILLPPPYSTKEVIAALFLWSAIFPLEGVRPQIIGWVFLTILIRILWSKWKKYKWFLPLLMLVWVNMHGSFALGAAIVTFFIFFRMIKEKSVKWKDVILWIATLGATVINPYVIRIWGEVLTVSSDINLKWAIVEWRPSFTSPNIAFFLFATLTGFFWWRFRTRIAHWKTFVAAILFLLAISANRHTVLFVAFATPLCVSLLRYFEMEAVKYKGGSERVKIFFRLLAVVASITFLFHGIFTVHSALNIRESVLYPQQAVGYLQKKSFQGELFSHFNWGGYLVWKLPQKKVFIDGRMASWRLKSTPGESNSAFQEYLEIKDGKHVNESFKKYQVWYVLWPYQTKEETIPKDKFLSFIEKEGWKLVYQDETAVVYKHPLLR
jgi:hypothetical protein